MSKPSEKAVELGQELYDSVLCIADDQATGNGKRNAHIDIESLARVIDKIIAAAKDK